MLKGRTTHCPFWIMSTNSSHKNVTWSSQDLWGPRSKAACWSSGSHGEVEKSTGTPWCLYWRRSFFAGCRSRVRSLKSPRPRRCSTKRVHPSCCTRWLSLAINLPRSLGMRELGGEDGRVAGDKVGVDKANKLVLVILLLLPPAGNSALRLRGCEAGCGSLS